MSALYSRLMLLGVALVGSVACAPRPAAAPSSPTSSNAGDDDESNIRPGSAEVTPVTETPAAASSANSPEPAAAGTQDVPTTCSAAKEDLCVPDATFVKRLCNASYPDVALVLMAKESTFTRMYMKGDVDGWNADGGASVRSHLYFDEEVLALKRRPPPNNGIVVGASGGFLVMRWDGTCFTLDEGEVTTKKPPESRVKHGPIPWRAYSDRTREALLKNARVLAAFQKRGKECKGATTGMVSLACEKADTALSATVVAEVRAAGVTLPRPDRRP